MMVRYARYDLATGRIVNVGHCSAGDLPLQELPGFGLIEGDANIHADHVSLLAAPAIEPRPVLAGFDRLTIAAGGQEFARLVADRPFTVTIDGDPAEVAAPDTEGRYVLELGGMVPAVYSVTVDCWPYLPYTAEVVAL